MTQLRLYIILYFCFALCGLVNLTPLPFTRLCADEDEHDYDHDRGRPAGVPGGRPGLPVRPDHGGLALLSERVRRWL